MTPDAIVDSVADVELPWLRELDIRGITLDLDNTIVPWYSDRLVPGVAEWAAAVREAGIRMCVLTNNYGTHAKGVAEKLDMPLVRGALKPLPGAFRHSLRTLETDAAHALCIGDQLFTDILGARLVGMRSVYVRPIATRAFLTTKILRLLEQPVLARLRRAGVGGA